MIEAWVISFNNTYSIRPVRLVPAVATTLLIERVWYLESIILYLLEFITWSYTEPHCPELLARLSEISSTSTARNYQKINQTSQQVRTSAQLRIQWSSRVLLSTCTNSTRNKKPHTLSPDQCLFLPSSAEASVHSLGWSLLHATTPNPNDRSHRELFLQYYPELLVSIQLVGSSLFCTTHTVLVETCHYEIVGSARECTGEKRHLWSCQCLGVFMHWHVGVR